MAFQADQVAVVLVHTSHPGNIGAAARAMKTMGLSQLVLVSPQEFPCSHATALAAGADDVLFNAKVVDTVEEAIAGCELVIATSARDRSRPWPMLNPRDMAEKVVTESASQKVAILFGRERTGLLNEELQLAQYHVQIPSMPDYYSLNLAQAVQVLCYEIRVASLGEVKAERSDVAYPSNQELENFYQHLEKTLVELQFIDPENPRMTMQNLRRLFTRSRLEALEVQLLRGVLARVNKLANP